MKKSANVLICVIMSSFLNGCGTAFDPRLPITGAIDSHDPYYKNAETQYQTLNSSPGPFQLQDLSVPRPTGQGWNLISFELPTSNSICFTKNFHEPGHSAFAKVDILPQVKSFGNVEEYTEWYRNGLFSQTNSQNLLLNYSIIADKKYGEFCLKYFTDIETIEKRTFSQKIWRTREWGYYFLLPNQLHENAYVTYFETGSSTEVATNLPSEAEAFLNGVEIK